MTQNNASLEFSTSHSNATHLSVSIPELLSKDDKYLHDNEHQIVTQLGGIRNILESLNSIQTQHARGHTIDNVVTDIINNEQNHDKNTKSQNNTTRVTQNIKINTNTHYTNYNHNNNVNDNEHKATVLPVTNPDAHHGDLSPIIANTTTSHGTDTRPKTLFHMDSTKKQIMFTIFPFNDLIHGLMYKTLSEANYNRILDYLDSYSLFVTSKRFGIIPVITTIFAMIGMIIPDLRAMQIIFNGFWVIEILMLIAVFDSRIMKEQIYSFDAWFRLYNMLVFYICNIIMITDHYPNSNLSMAQGIFDLIQSTITTYFVINIDAFAINKTLRLAVLMLIISWFSVVFWLYYYNTNKDTEIEIFDRHISMKTVAISALFNVILFFVKQFGLLIYQPGFATNISYSPKLLIVKYQKST